MRKFSRDSFLNASEIIDRLKTALALAVNIKEIPEELDTDLDLAHFLDVAQSTVAGYRRRNKVPYELLLEAANKYDISLDHILLDKHTIERYWLFPALISHPGDTQPPLEPAIPVPPDRPWHIVLNRTVPMGHDRYFMLEMPDNTMSPTFPEGGLLVVDSASDEIRKAAVYVLREGGSWLIRRALPSSNNMVRLVADNGAYPSEVRTLNEVVVVGEVVKVFKDVV